LEVWRVKVAADVERLDWSEVAVEPIEWELEVSRLSLANDQAAGAV
jgi:hypothetical protein